MVKNMILILLVTSCKNQIPVYPYEPIIQADIMSINRHLKEMTLMEYGVVVAVVFVIAIGIYAGIREKRGKE